MKHLKRSQALREALEAVSLLREYYNHPKPGDEGYDDLRAAMKDYLDAYASK